MHVLMRVALAMTAMLAASAAMAEPREVPRGDPERRALLDTVRPAVEVDVQGAVEFTVDRLAIEDGWAVFFGAMQHPGGLPIDCAATRYARDCDFMDGFSVFALLKDEGRRWRLVDLGVGPTDAFFTGWPEAYGAPCSLIGRLGC